MSPESSLKCRICQMPQSTWVMIHAVLLLLVLERMHTARSQTPQDKKNTSSSSSPSLFHSKSNPALSTCHHVSLRIITCVVTIPHGMRWGGRSRIEFPLFTGGCLPSRSSRNYPLMRVFAAMRRSHAHVVEATQKGVVLR